MKTVPVTTRKRVAAMAECKRCHYRFPKPEMHEVKSSNSRIYYAASGSYKGASVGERTGWVCDECYPAYKRESRGFFSAIWWGILRFALGFIGGPTGRR